MLQSKIDLWSTRDKLIGKEEDEVAKITQDIVEIRGSKTRLWSWDGFSYFW